MKRKRPGAGGYAGYEVNRRDGDELIMLVGKLIVNCGAVELLTFIWIRELTTDGALFDVAMDMPLGRRIDLIMDLLKERGADPKLLAKSKKAWGEVRKLAEVRNIVAHGPLAFGWNGPERPGSVPDFIGTPILKDMKRNKTGQLRIARVEGLAKVVDRSVDVATVISDLMDEVFEALPQSSNDPTKSA